MNFLGQAKLTAIWHIITYKIMVFPVRISRSSLQFATLGSEHGRKVFSPALIAGPSFVISAGVGEDISFDVEFLEKYPHSKIVLVDPTERSRIHFTEISNYLGKSKTLPYSGTGKQNVESYNLSNVTKWNLVLENVALGANGRKLKLFAPANQEHVSYSLVDFQKSAIEVEFPSVDLLTVMIKQKKEKVDLLKLDVEGSASVILKKAFTDGIYPTQILLEIDEVNYPGIRNFFRVIKLVYLLKKNRYKFVQSIGHSEFCLVLS